MQVSKWGNSLAIRLPAAVVEALELKDGDEIEVSIVGSRDFKIARDSSREKAIATLRGLARPLPPGFKFDREELNER
jgi:antitoxin MazE